MLSETVAPFTLFVPIFWIASSVIFLDEPLQIWKIAVGLLVLSGVCINMFGSRIQKRLLAALYMGSLVNINLQ